VGSRKLIAVGALTTVAVAYLAFLGAASSWQYYVSVDEAVADAQQLRGKRIRVSGSVQAGSLSIDESRRLATFVLSGERHTLPIICRCALPDNLTEDIEVVVEGKYHEDRLDGHKVITRCASKYEARDAYVAQH
jgi:cytochrome c-type biogenesis protein CcmE